MSTPYKPPEGSPGENPPTSTWTSWPATAPLSTDSGPPRPPAETSWSQEPPPPDPRSLYPAGPETRSTQNTAEIGPPPATKSPNDYPSGRRLAIAAAVIVLAVAVGFFIIKSQHHTADTSVAGVSSTSESSAQTVAASQATPTSTPPSPKPTPGLASARSIDRLITHSVAQRRLLTGPIRRINQCQATTTDTDQLAAVGRARRALIQQLGAVKLDGLVGGGQIIAGLRSAWTASAAADDAYSVWGQDNLECFGGPNRVGDSAYARLTYYNSVANRDKTAVVAKWNVIARRYKLATRSSKAI